MGDTGVSVGVVSDTHDNLGLVEAAVDRFATAGVDVVVHCGDFVAPFSATPFDGDWEFYAVRGNNDGEWALGRAVDGFGTYLGEMGEVELGDSRAAVYHGTSEPLVDALVDAGTYDYVFRGHTHAATVEERDGTVHLNPGGLPIPVDGADDTFRVATVETATGTVEHHDLDSG